MVGTRVAGWGWSGRVKSVRVRLGLGNFVTKFSSCSSGWLNIENGIPFLNHFITPLRG